MVGGSHPPGIPYYVHLLVYLTMCTSWYTPVCNRLCISRCVTGCVYPGVYTLVYTPLCTPWCIPRYVHPGICTPGYMHPCTSLGIWHPTHPGYTRPYPGCTCRTAARCSREGCTALRRVLTEQTVTVAGVTVAGYYRHPFHCWLRLRIMLRRQPSLGPQREEREACCEEKTPFSHPIVAESEEEKGPLCA